MSEKHKSFLSLSSRQKRRRISGFRKRIAGDVITESESSLDEVHPVPENSAYSDSRLSPCDCHDFNESENSSDAISVDSLDSGEDEGDMDGENPEELRNVDSLDSKEDEGYMDGENPEELRDVEEEEEPEDPVEVKKRILKNAFITARLTHSQGNIILKVLRTFPFGLIYLPKDSRTLLKTPADVASRRIEQIAGGEYLHLDLKSTLKKN